MEKDTFEQIKRESKNEKNKNTIEISSTGYGYESETSNSVRTEFEQAANTNEKNADLRYPG